ncbi:hypothetical protein UB46_42455 [Burkholderiaceae bacterium 16]|nr:hypothetical protein UB46_42455 [Burkholderiaceae bacterium 16]
MFDPQPASSVLLWPTVSHDAVAVHEIMRSKLLPTTGLCKCNGQVLHLLFQLIALFCELCNQ